MKYPWVFNIIYFNFVTVIKKYMYFTCSNDTSNFYTLNWRMFLQPSSLKENHVCVLSPSFFLFHFPSNFFPGFFIFYFFLEDWFDPFLQLKSGFSWLSICEEYAKKCFLVKQLTITFASRCFTIYLCFFLCYFQFFLSFY